MGDDAKPISAAISYVDDTEKVKYGFYPMCAEQFEWRVTMDAVELIRKVVELGADEKEIIERFSGNIELYSRCYENFLEEPNFVLLRESIRVKNYDKAFEAAHTLKGISGNLGVASFYEAMYALVESLRAKDYQYVEMEYAQVLHQYEKLEKIRTILNRDKLDEQNKSDNSLKKDQFKILAMYETDVEGALQRLNGNERLYEKCLRAFLDDSSMKQLRESVEASSWDTAFTAAHALKGVAGNMGFVPLMHAVGQLVVIIRSGRVHEIEQSFEKVNESYKNIIQGICKFIAIVDGEERKEAI